MLTSQLICGVSFILLLFVLVFKRSFGKGWFSSKNTEVHSKENHKHKTKAMKLHFVS